MREVRQSQPAKCWWVFLSGSLLCLIGPLVYLDTSMTLSWLLYVYNKSRNQVVFVL